MAENCARILASIILSASASLAMMTMPAVNRSIRLQSAGEKPLCGQRLLQKAGQAPPVPRGIYENALHSGNLSRSTRITPSSSLLGAMWRAMALRAGWAFSIA